MWTRQVARAAALLLLGFLELAVVLSLTGVAAGEALRISAVLAVSVAAGAVLWQSIVRRDVSVFEAVGFGFAVSSAIQVIGHQALLALGFNSPWIMVVVPPLLAAIALWQQTRSGQRFSIDADTRQALLVGGALLLIVAVHWMDLAQYGLGAAQDLRTYSTDMFWFETMGNDLASARGFGNGLVAGYPAHYHWFGYGWAGWLTRVTDASPFVVQTRVIPLVGLVATMSAVAGWTALRSKKRWAAVVAGALVVPALSLSSTDVGLANWDSPSLTFATLWLIACALVAVDVIETRVTPMRAVFLIVFGVCVTVGKSSHWLVIDGALVLMVAWMAVQRSGRTRRTIVVAALVGVSSLVAYVYFVSGQPAGGGLSPNPLLGGGPEAGSTFAWATTALAIMLGTAPRWAGLVRTMTVKANWSDATSTLGSFAAISGVAAFLALDGSAGAHVWFLSAAAALVVVPSVWGLSEAREDFGSGRRGTTALVVLVLVGCAVAIAMRVGIDAAVAASDFVLGFPRTVWVGAIGVAALVIASVAVAWVIAVPDHITRVRAATSTWAVAGTAAAITFGLLYPLTSGVDDARSGTSPNQPVPIFTIDSPAAQEDLLKATEWVRARSSVGELIAGQPDSGAVVPSLVGLTAFADLLAMAERQVPGAQSIATERNERVDAFLSGSSDARDDLCRSGVRWVWSTTAPADGSLVDTTRSVTTPTVSILRIACPSGT